MALVFAVFLLCWMCITVIKKWYQETAMLVIAGVTAALLSLPYLSSLRGPGAGGSLLQLKFRPFILVELFVKSLQPWQTLAANILLLPLNYFLESGTLFRGWLGYV